MHIRAAQCFGGYILAGGSFDQWRSAQENGAGAAHDDGLIAHGRHIRPAGGAGAHHHRDLGDAFGAHARHVIENAAKIVRIRENFILHGQENAARVDQIDTRQGVLLGNVLGAQVFLHGQWKIGAAFDRGIIGNDHHLMVGHPPNAGDDAGAGRLIVVHAPGCQRGKLQKGRARVEQPVDAVAHE